MRLFIVGITGAMGNTLLDCLANEECVAGFAREKGMVGKIPVYNAWNQVTESFDCLIDFSNAACVREVVAFAKEKKVPLVEATTGLNEDVVQEIQKASAEIPIVYAQNMSIGVNTMDTAVGLLTKMLSGFDIEMIEKHHNKKKDAPSGTAKMLYETIRENRTVHAIYDRTKDSNPRSSDEIGISSVRAGSIVGEHTVIFAGTDEVLEIKHSAGSKKIFAKGAIRAARFLQHQSAGLFDMKDVLKEDQ